MDAIGEGTVKIVTIVNGVKCKIHLQHTLLVLALANSLLSIKTLNHQGYSALFRPHTMFIVNLKEVVLGESEKGGNLYDLHIVCSPVLCQVPLTCLLSYLSFTSTNV